MHKNNPFLKRRAAKNEPVQILKKIKNPFAKGHIVIEATVLTYDVEEPSWIPPPREYATLLPKSFDLKDPKNFSLYYIGGMNYDTVKEISELKIT